MNITGTETLGSTSSGKVHGQMTYIIWLNCSVHASSVLVTAQHNLFQNEVFDLLLILYSLNPRAFPFPIYAPIEFRLLFCLIYNFHDKNTIMLRSPSIKS